MEEKIEEAEQIQKTKKPRSEKQIEAFNKARQIRTEKALLKKQKIKEVKDTINATPIQDLKPETLAEVKPKKQPKVIQLPDESSDEEILLKKELRNQPRKLLFTRKALVKKRKNIYHLRSLSENQNQSHPEKLFKHIHRFYSFN